MPEVPAWLTVALAIITGLVGNFAKPLFDFGARRAEAAVKAAESLRDDMLQYAAQVRADQQVVTQQFNEVRQHYIEAANTLIDFRTFVLAEAGKAQSYNDRKEHEQVGRHLDNLIGGAKKVRLPFGNSTEKNR